MLGSIRSLRVTLTLFGLAISLAIGRAPVAAAPYRRARGNEAQATAGKDAKGGREATPKAAPARQKNPTDLSEFFAQPGDDPPRAFVPLRPSTTDDRRRLDVVRLYSTGRASKIGRPGPMPSRCFRKPSSWNPIRSRSRGG